MLFMDVDGTKPDQRALATFFAQAHSGWAQGEGIHLAIWTGQRAPQRRTMTRAASQQALFGWIERGRLRTGRVPFDSLDETLQEGDEVVLARRKLSQQVMHLLETRLGYRATALHQVDGWWSLEHAKLNVRPTGALLAPRGVEALQKGVEHLVLVDVADRWVVLSERGLRAYVFGSALADGQDVVFVPRGQMTVFQARRVGEILYRDIGQRFGQDAADRARDDAPSILIALS